jgi:uncharacterized protein YqjF (DUF2071 family)
MSKPRPFLTAQWRNLGLVTYAIDPALLQQETPPGCSLDLRDRSAFVSFVMFDFLDTKVKGIRWPGYVNFPEINLRFYVRRDEQRGVCFIRELVPKRLIAWIASTIYNEPYIATKMKSNVRVVGDKIEAAHEFWCGDRWHRAKVTAKNEPAYPPAGGVEDFFKEHQWGFGRSRGGARRRYEVQHPIWRIYPGAAAQMDVDFYKVYGQKWAFLNTQPPTSVILAEGSEIAVFPHADIG